MSGLAWGGDPNSRDSRGWTLLHHAVYKGAHEIAQLLIENGANVNASDRHDRTPLLLACYRGNHQIADLLLEAGAEVNVQDWAGQTPLHWAAYEGTVETVQLLLDFGADTTIKNKEGLRYDNLLLKHLTSPSATNDADTVVRLLSAGADQYAEVVGTGVNPMEEAKRCGFYDILRQMASLAKKEAGEPAANEEQERENGKALEDVHRLFEGANITEDAGSKREEVGQEEEEEEEDEGRR
nr:ankyrin repeat and SOCS box protein 8-like [Penaeus vannamei]